MTNFIELPTAIQKKYENVVVIGKFMPMHKGHEFLFGFAKAHSKNVFVLVDNTPNDTIDVEVRAKIIQEAHPELNVSFFKNKMPQDPSETDDFWNIWSSGMKGLVNASAGKETNIDAVVASMDYGKKLAESLSCDFLPLDVARSTLNISATQIRNDTQKYFNFISDAFKPNFVKKYAFIGAESTGKTTVIERLITEFEVLRNGLTASVPEYAYQYMKTFKGEFTPDCVPLFITAQEAQMNLASKTSNGVLLCDSNALTTKVYGQYVFPEIFGNFPEELENYVIKQNFEMTFLFKPDENTKFKEDIHRQVFKKEAIEKSRLDIFNAMEQELIKSNIPYMVIEGNYENRFKQVRDYLSNYLE